MNCVTGWNYFTVQHLTAEFSCFPPFTTSLSTSHQPLSISTNCNQLELSDSLMKRGWEPKPLTYIDRRYQLMEVIGEGSFGECCLFHPRQVGSHFFDVARTGKVYQASDLAGGKEVVVKVKHRGVFPSTLQHEYMILWQLAAVESIPCPLWFGEEDGQNLLILNQLGPSLEEVFTTCKHNLALYTIANIAEQLVRITPSLHSNWCAEALSHRLIVYKISMPRITSIETSNQPIS